MTKPKNPLLDKDTVESELGKNPETILVEMPIYMLKLLRNAISKVAGLPTRPDYPGHNL